MAAVTVPPLSFVSRFPSIRPVLVALLLVLAAYAVAAPASAGAADSGFRSAEVTAAHFFEPLEHNVVDVAGEFADGTPFAAVFLDNFTHTGGIERWGYPTSAVFEESPGSFTQYYQRGVVDWQPPPGGGAHSFQRRLAWDYLGGGLGGSTDLGVELHLTNPNPGEEFGPWGHKVSNTSVEGVPIGFADFFHRLGGVASFGFPKTDARSDTHPEAVLHTPGRQPDERIRQYFQSAVLEYHPESSASPVKLGLLGDTLRDSRYPRRAWQQYLAFGPEAPLAVGDRLALGVARRGPHGSSTEDVARFLELSLLRVQTDRACGSGFVVREDGYAVTAWNLVRDARSISVSSPRGHNALAHLVAGDAQRGLALIRVDGDGHVPVTWDDSGGPAVGDEVLAFGFRSTSLLDGRGVECQTKPKVESRSFTHVASAERFDFRPPTDVGSSGGPMVARSGWVVGMIAGGSPERPSAEAFVPAAVVQPHLSKWMADLDRGQAPGLPAQPSVERVVLAELDSLSCPGQATHLGYWDDPMAFRVAGREIELTATVALNLQLYPVALIEYGHAFRETNRRDQIIFGVWRDHISQATLRWQRGSYRNPFVIRDEKHPDVYNGAEFEVRFVYNSGSVALFINGGLVHQDAGFPFGDTIDIGIGCTDTIDSPDLNLYDIRVTGIPATNP